MRVVQEISLSQYQLLAAFHYQLHPSLNFSKQAVGPEFMHALNLVITVECHYVSGSK